MNRVLVLCCSGWGHVEAMANAVAEGARRVPGVVVDLRRVPELVPDSVAHAAHHKTDQAATIAEPEELAHHDAIVFGTPSRLGTHGGRGTAVCV